MEAVEAVVVGAGVIGLAVARALALRGVETVVLERAEAIGTCTSSRNSEVIHAGIYYPTGSLKATLCVRGREQLYAYCKERAIDARRCGKLLVATDEAQRLQLARIHAQAARNGVSDMVVLEAGQLRSMEPHLNAVAALHSPSTGIVDSHGVMLALLGEFEANGGALAVLSPLVDATLARRSPEPHVLRVGGQSPMTLGAKIVVNAAGLWAPGVATLLSGLPPGEVPLARYAKGNYFSLASRAPFSRLIYPLPQKAGLGVHLTLDLAGQARFGPDVEWIAPNSPEEIDYRVDESRADAFEAEIRRYWPELPSGALQPAYSGVRPKLEWPGKAATQDFVLQGPEAHGFEGLMNLYGIESPGLTACLALADEVVRRLLP